jgi:hypothetical protein
MYIVEPGETEKVEANPDAIGLKVGIIFDTSRDNQEMHFFRFICHNDSTLTITSMDTEDIDYFGEGTNLIGKGKLKESSVEPFNMAAETCNMELATKKVNRAAEEMKRIVNKVKDSTEGAIKTVTGKEVNLDFINISQPTENLLFNREPSMSSLSSSATGMDSRFSMPANSNTGNMYHTNQTNNLYGNANNPNKASSAGQASGKPPQASTAKSSQAMSNGIASPPVQETAPPAKTLQEDDNAAQERWEAELERAKRQKRWEMEIERIRRERMERERLAESEHQQQFAEAQIAPIVGKGGCACVIC